jgi:hypothetical protein
VAIGDIVKLSVIGAMFGSRINFGWHFRHLGADLDHQDLSDAYQTACSGPMLNCMTQDVGILGFEVSSVRVSGPETLFDPVSGNVVGQFAGASLPPQDAMCASVHTGLKGRRRRGRFYIPGIVNTPGTGGEIPTLQRAQLEGFLTALKANFTLGGATPNPNFRMVVFSPADPLFRTKKGEATRLTELVTDATNITYDTVIRSQRRRQKGVGE